MVASLSGSTTLFTFALLGITGLTILLLRYYLPLRRTPAYLLLPVFLALALPASIILLVPVDLASSAFEEDGSARGVWLPSRAMIVLWRITYWLTFVLTWLMLPLLGEYADAGHREPRQRMIYSLRSNAKFQLAVLACSAVGLVYFFLENGFKFTSLKSLVMALAYAWGLVLAIYLMGHGLVAIPRKLYKNARVSARLRHLESQASRIQEKLTDAIDELEDLEGQVLKLRQRKNGSARDFQDWIEELGDSTDLPESRSTLDPASRNTDAAVPTVITERYLAELTRKLKRARHKKTRFVDEWDRLVHEARDCQDILDATGSRKLEFKRQSASNPLTRLIPLSPTTRYYLHANVIPIFRLLASFFLGAASICIIWSEVVKSALPTVPKLSIVGTSIIHHPNSKGNGKIGFAGQVMAGSWLLYMCVAALFSVTEVRVWGNRALVRRRTYPESACWYASLVARLTVPLAFNFVTLVEDDIKENTTFYALLGKSVNLTPLGEGFNDYFPIFILLPVIATTFNLYSKVSHIFGYGAFEDETDEGGPNSGVSSWREGRALIERDWNGTAANINALGLSSPRPRSPVPPTNRYTDAFSSQTNLSSPAAATGGRLSPAPNSERQRLTTHSPQPSRPAPQDQRYQDEPASTSASASASASAPPSAEGNFFEDFAHRMRNTFDTAEPPEWIAKIPKPKWMGGDGASPPGGSRGRAGDGGGGSGQGALSRFFSEGGLRI